MCFYENISFQNKYRYCVCIFNDNFVVCFGNKEVFCDFKIFIALKDCTTCFVSKTQIS